MSNNTIYIIAGVLLFLAYRNGTAQGAGHEAAIPSDPYGCMNDQWSVLNSDCPNAHPSTNDVMSRGDTGLGGVGVC